MSEPRFITEEQFFKEMGMENPIDYRKAMVDAEARCNKLREENTRLREALGPCSRRRGRRCGLSS